MVKVILLAFAFIQLQPAKAKLPMLLTLGISLKHKLEQPLNAKSPILVDKSLVDSGAV